MTRVLILALSVAALTACSSVTPEKMAQIKPGMKIDQVQAILGRPATIEQSQTADQTLSGEVDHYPGSRGEGRVVFLNDAVFKAEFVPETKS